MALDHVETKVFDLSLSVFSRDALPSACPSLSLFQFTAPTLYFNDGVNSSFVRADISTAKSELSTVPLPAALPLLAAGLSAMGFMG
jgi:hypothetical protein